MVKPWHRVASEPPPEPEKPLKQNNGTQPLVPERWVKVPTQRLVVVVLFAALQWIKLKAALSPSISDAIVFSILDALFLWILPYFAIPWLTFRPLATASQIVLMVSINTLLFVDPIWLTVFTSAIIKYLTGTELSVMGTRVRKNTLGSHSLGSYVVNYLPELSASLSADEQLCTTGQDQVYLHLTLNATWPESVSLRVTPLIEDGQPAMLNFTKRDLGKLPKRGSTDLWLPIDQPGAYQLATVKDAKSGNPVLVSTAMNAVVVPPCPKSWLEVDTSPTCQGQKRTAVVVSEGIAPFRIKLADGKTLETAKGAAKYAVSRQKTSLDLLAVPGLQIGLISVQDALGNERKLKETTKIPVYRPSTARLSNQRLALLDEPVAAQVEVDGEDGPFELAYSRDKGDPVLTQVNQGPFKLMLDSPGTYELTSLHGNLCPGSVSGSVEVFTPPPVTLKVEFQQIKDPCAGPSGIDADITLTGTPPFRVYYRAMSSGRVLFEKELRLNKNTDRVKFKPHSVGTFEYEFTAVADLYRRVSLQGDQYVQQQTISELAGASLMPMRTRYCPGQQVEVSAKLQGKAPLTLEYSVDDKTYTLDNLSQSAALPLGELAGGVHAVRLVSITDARGCKTPLDVRSPDIHIRTERSRVKFASPGLRRVTSPSQTLELEIDNGQPPYQIKYSVNGVVKSVDVKKPELSVNEAGVFKLISFRDSECEGDVDEMPVTLELIPRPSLKLGDGQVSSASLCLGSATAVILEATGQPPFTLHDHAKASTVISDTAFTLDVDPVATAGPTTMYYWMNDANYKEASDPVKIIFDVPQAPTAQFKNGDYEYKVCQGASSLPPILVSVSGKGAFELLIDVENVATGKKFRTAAADPGSDSNGLRHFGLTSVYDEITPGLWKLSIHSVNDGTNCGSKPGTGKPVFIDMSPAPFLGGAEQESHICVGDYVDVSLHGHAPFELEYSFESRKLSALAESKFRRLSSFPGRIVFDKVRDAAGCEADLANSVVVHDLPTSKITHQPQFSIHHGETVDLAFEFTGTPPFTFTYTRSIRGKVVDRRTVSDVKEHTYSIYTQEEGTYEVVELRDRYCQVTV